MGIWSEDLGQAVQAVDVIVNLLAIFDNDNSTMGTPIDKSSPSSATKATTQVMGRMGCAASRFTSHPLLNNDRNLRS